jgi:integrative and conjugative element protein (TIGR02256 family)
VDVFVSGPTLKFKVGQISISIESQVLATFDAHRQRRFYQREAGGQLFARVWDDEWEIVSATGPRSRDRRGRFSFWPHRASEQEEIFEYHALGFDYVGDWHTHPEDKPNPSSDDLTSISEVVRRSTHHLPGFLLMIVGRSPFPHVAMGLFPFARRRFRRSPEHAHLTRLRRHATEFHRIVRARDREA